MFKKLRTVIYHVKDLQKAKEWYINITGVQPYFDEAFYAGFNINGFELGLDPDFENVQEGNQSVAYWAVDNIEMALKKLVLHNAVVIHKVLETGGGIKVAAVLDPFGNTVGLIEEPSHPA